MQGKNTEFHSNFFSFCFSLEPWDLNAVKCMCKIRRKKNYNFWVCPKPTF